MNALLVPLAQIRVWLGQILVLCFTYWVTLIPFAIMAVDELGKLLHKIRPQ